MIFNSWDSTDYLCLQRFKKIFGVNKKKLKKYCIIKGLNPNINIFFLKYNITSKIIVKIFFNDLYGKRLRKYIMHVFNFLWKIRNYRGFRHKMQLPSRGQRTRTNSRTKRKFKCL